MVDTFKFLFVFLVLSLVTKGLCQECTPDNNPVGQVQTKNIVGGQPQWRVTVYNNCNCSRSHIVLRCHDFQSAEKVDPLVLAQLGDGNCLLINGDPISPFSSVSFTYAFYPPYALIPDHWDVDC